MDPLISLRRARTEDAAFLLALRNAPDVVASSREQRTVSEQEHAAWLQSTLSGAGRRLFVIEAGGVPIGQGRLDVRGDDEWVSIALVDDARGRGYAFAALEALQRETDHDLAAEIRVENESSQRLFTRAGFTVVARDERFVTMRWAMTAGAHHAAKAAAT